MHLFLVNCLGGLNLSGNSVSSLTDHCYMTEILLLWQKTKLNQKYTRIRPVLGKYQFWSYLFYNVTCLRTLIYCYIFRNVCPFWTKHATFFKILLVYSTFKGTISYKCTLKVCELGLRGDRHWLLEPTSWLRLTGKKNLLSQNWSNSDAKNNRLYDFYHIFDFHVQKTRGPKMVQLIS